MSIAVIIQARMSSSRFPEKMLQPLAGGTLLSQVIHRLGLAQRVDRIILATSDGHPDDALASEAAQYGVEIVRGPLDDVLGRYALALDETMETVVRVTGDCPLLDPGLLDEMLAEFSVNSYDYLSNVSPPSWPDGLDLEIIRADALRDAAAETLGPRS